jgi:hypothetical protein
VRANEYSSSLSKKPLSASVVSSDRRFRWLTAVFRGLMLAVGEERECREIHGRLRVVSMSNFAVTVSVNRVSFTIGRAEAFGAGAKRALTRWKARATMTRN